LVVNTVLIAVPLASGTNRRKQRQGIYRIRYPGRLGNDVRTRKIGGDEELTIEESLYRARKYDPPVEQLPWDHDYFATKTLV
jgi:hypothetical protein